MSKNFELMQQVRRRPEAVAIPQPVEVVPETQPTAACSNRIPDWPEVERDREDSFRLVTRIFRLGTLNSARTVLFSGLSEDVSSGPICLPVAEALKSAVSGSVCIVEANFTSPSLETVLGAARYGFIDALVRDEPIRSFAKTIYGESLWFLPFGSAAVDCSDFLKNGRVTSRFDELRREFDYVIVDAPPLTRHTELTALGQRSDGLVLVLEANATRKDAVLSAIESLRSAQIQMLGAVVNRRTFTVPEGRYKTAAAR